jgi:hypothetical protein
VPGVRRLTPAPSTRRSARRAVKNGEAGGVMPGPSQPVRAPSPPDEPSAAQPPNPGLGELIARFAESAEDGELGSTPTPARVLLRQIAMAAAASARQAGVAAVASGRWLTDTLIEVAPHVPVRDLETLRRHHRGLEGEALADALTRNASLASAAVGAGGGAVAAISWSTPVSLATVPLQLVVETLAVAAIEIKLVAELHEVYALPVYGTGTQRGLAFAAAWANRRGVNPLDPKAAASVLSRTTRARIQRRLVSRTGRSVGTATPFLLGAAFGAWFNRRNTAELAEQLRLDLRRRRPLTGGIAGHLVRRALRAAR